MNLIFRKQFFLLTAGLIVSFLLLALGVIQAFNTYFYNQKSSEMSMQADSIAKIYNNCVINDRFDYENFLQEIDQADLFLDNSYAVFNYNQELVWASSNNKSSIDVAKLKELNGISDVLDGKTVYYNSGKFNFFTDNQFLVGVPIINNDEVIGAAFIKTTTSQLRITTYDSYRIIIIFMCVAIIINFVIIYFSSKKFAKPLKEMSDAAKVIARGNFEKRLEINSADEIGDLADSFNEMAQSLYIQEKRRRDFISDISHDLRSPLTSMRGFLQAILDGTIPQEKQEHYLRTVLDESERLAKLANNILDINKLEDSSVINISEFNIIELLNKTMTSFEDRVAHENIQFATNFEKSDITVRADYDKIQRVIYNLIDNAIKFTNNKGTITLGVRVEGNKAYISVADDGIGISEDEQKLVFERLYKADKSRGKDKKGSGLGLSIVKELIKAHNEEIILESKLGKGSTFTFSLPYVKKN